MTAAEFRIASRTEGKGRASAMPRRSIFSTKPRARPFTKYSWNGIESRPRIFTKVRTRSSLIGRMRDLTPNRFAMSAVMALRFDPARSRSVR